MQLEIVRCFYYFICFFVYLTKREKAETNIISLLETSNKTMLHATIETHLRAPGIDQKVKTLKLVPSSIEEDLNLQINASVVAAAGVQIRNNFPAAPTFVKCLNGKTYALLKIEY